MTSLLRALPRAILTAVVLAGASALPARAAEVRVGFAPPGGEAVTISAPGGVRLLGGDGSVLGENAQGWYLRRAGGRVAWSAGLQPPVTPRPATAAAPAPDATVPGTADGDRSVAATPATARPSPVPAPALPVSLVEAVPLGAAPLRVNCGKWARLVGGRVSISPNGGRWRLVAALEVDEYLRGVLPAEMGSSFAPEALKAQAVVARTYALRQAGRHGSKGYDVCDSTDCQVWRGSGAATSATDAAIQATAGLVLSHGGRLASTPFHADCGGASESPDGAWPGQSPPPYLRSVPDRLASGEDYCRSCRVHEWTLALSPVELARALRAVLPPGTKAVPEARIVEATETGRVRRIALAVGTAVRSGAPNMTVPSVKAPTAARVTPIAFTPEVEPGVPTPVPTPTPAEPLPPLPTVEIVGAQLRRLLGPNRLRSTLFQVSTDASGQVVFTGRGWGHGVGLCQWGAEGRARAGHSYQEILAHYYAGTTLSAVITSRSRAGRWILASRGTLAARATGRRKRRRGRYARRSRRVVASRPPAARKPLPAAKPATPLALAAAAAKPAALTAPQGASILPVPPAGRSEADVMPIVDPDALNREPRPTPPWVWTLIVVCGFAVAATCVITGIVSGYFGFAR